jgi:hypothetical protein
LRPRNNSGLLREQEYCFRGRNLVYSGNTNIASKGQPSST